jgi:putative tricarboxylic transport membrane protein
VGNPLIPVASLGVPGDTIMTVLMGASMVHGLTPGSLLSSNDPTFVSWIYVTVLLGLVATLVLGLSIIRAAVLLTPIPPRPMYIVIAVFGVIGAFAMRHSINNVHVAIGFGTSGFVFSQVGLPTTSLALGPILGPILEENLRHSLRIGRGSRSIFLERPIAATLIGISALLLAAPLLAWTFRRLRRPARGRPGNRRTGTRHGSPKVLRDPWTPTEATTRGHLVFA